ncbi:MAG TPA: zf-HC2 domain-containing protein, partial [Candidatus Acidoferrum sp.]|nr:zf-HC2 domain-containing protein [Candidatus Acidoferrum sp.]
MSDTEKNNAPLDAILRRAMRQRPGALLATPECADAESLAAYSDQSMSAAERERLEAHFADCARCQLLLAEIARAGENARAAKSASVVPWYRRWRVAIPALAAAVAAVLVVIVMRRPANDESQRGELVAMAKREAPAMDLAARAPVQELPAAAPAPTPQVAAPASNEIAMNEEKPQVAPRAEAKSAEIPHHEQHRFEQAPAGARSMTPQVGPGAAPNAASAVAPAARAAPPSLELAERSAAPQLESASGEIRNGITQSAPATSAGAPIAQAGGGPAGAGAAVSRSAQLASRGFTGGPVVLPEVTIPAPDRSVIWIVGRNGMIQRRDANGAVRPEHSGVSTDLVA